jgi:putative transposase
MKPAGKREMVDHARAAWRVSIRHACRAVPVDRSTYHYGSKRAGQAPLAKRIREIAETRVRYGYRRIHVLLWREGWRVVKRVCRPYREQGLQLRNKSPKRRVKAKLREDRSPATGANQVLAMDFIHDQLFDGRKFRVLTMVDTFTQLSPAIDVRQSFREPTSPKLSHGSSRRSATHTRFVSTTAPSSSARISTCGLSCIA